MKGSAENIVKSFVLAMRYVKGVPLQWERASWNILQSSVKRSDLQDFFNELQDQTQTDNDWGMVRNLMVKVKEKFPDSDLVKRYEKERDQIIKGEVPDGV